MALYSTIANMVNYSGKLVLAPMVRAGELPTRLLSLKYGADLVWSPEIVDKKILQTERVVNTALNTIDHVLPNAHNNVVFRTFPSLERGKLIFQLGSADPDLAREAALKVIDDVDGIDLNCGCPKHFSIHSGMGAALLKKPEHLCSILTELVEKVGKPNNKPISCKIRILENEEDTLKLVRMICATGVANLTVHCRTTPMRNRESPIRDYINSIFDVCKEHNVSMIVNGAIKDREDYENLFSYNEELGGMIAESAESNPTVFSKEVKPWFVAVKEFLEIAKEFDNNIGNTKYMLSRLVPGKSKFFQYFAQCKNEDDLDYIMSLVNEKGEAKEDPSEYLTRRREEEKLLKKKLGEQKALEKKAAKEAMKRALEEHQEPNSSSKKPKIEC
ncbi:tRNA-dihydrouridine(20) synthase (NAD(+)) RNJ42_02467 [Nakaseomyces bracarensis]|uniref:tRNA-dihydrouridine(20) synthase (NAD(+)) n=1 Tax=Nakaseomyces bracarensis TaxID=273131 RepID=UPI0038711D06